MVHNVSLAHASIHSLNNPRNNAEMLTFATTKLLVMSNKEDIHESH